MSTDIPTRMGDGSLVRLSRDQIRVELEEGTQAAAQRAKVPPLTQDELDHLLDIYASPYRVVGVPQGAEVVLTTDGSGTQDMGSRLNDLQIYEQVICTDTIELYNHDYSYKAVKTILPYEQTIMRQAQLLTTVPLQYGAMPDLGRYTQPDGPVPNWSELLPLGRIDEARAAQEEAVEHSAADIEFVAEGMVEAGADGLDLDTVGAAGDADFLAALTAVAAIRARFPGFGIQFGMASEFVLGMHGQIEFDGTRLAGLWPLGQLRLAQKAGATVFGPAINVNTGKSCAWNSARALTIVKPCMAEAKIPVHLNVGMGVGGVPMHVSPPLDAVSRAARAAVDILKIDGL